MGQKWNSVRTILKSPLYVESSHGQYRPYIKVFQIHNTVDQKLKSDKFQNMSMGPDILANLLLTMPFSSKLEQQLQVYVEKKITFLFKFHPTSSFISRNMKLIFHQLMADAAMQLTLSNFFGWSTNNFSKNDLFYGAKRSKNLLNVSVTKLL